MDEVVAFVRQLRGLQYDAFHAFIQSLTEAAAAVEGAVVVGSLPESGAEVGDEQGRDALRRLEKIFGRVQSAWTPASGIETFEIVRRRLFQPLDEAGEKAREDTVRAFRRLYWENRADFPAETREAAYEEQMRRAYPLHPEVLRRFSGDWSVLEKFQRTRGVLKIMANAVYALVYLPRLRDEATLDGALQRLVENLADPFAYASGFDEESGSYEDVMDGRALMPGHFKSGLLVRREAIPAERADSEPSRPGVDGSSARDIPPPEPENKGEAPASPPRPKRFFASLEIDPERAGLEVARIMDGLLVELTRAPGSALRLHLEIEGTAGNGGYPEDVVDTVKANARDLRLDEASLGFEEK